ncbi:MAG: DUF1211 domain-containing protein [Deinococcales bacterium]|nr:DUF1211 domain-containing protein [Chitinophagaceae bacterium]
MGKGRLEAFSDGVMAIIITIMVLEMKVPQTDSLVSILPVLPVFISYVLSFLNVAIYWNNHHHIIHAAETVNAPVMWANIHLLFWLSLFPFVTGWMGENHFAKWPVVLYGFVSLMAGVAYYILARCLVKLHGKRSTLSAALARDKKGAVSVFIYSAGIALSFVHPLLGFAMYFAVATMWFIPDKRIEEKLVEKEAIQKKDTL